MVDDWKRREMYGDVSGDQTASTPRPQSKLAAMLQAQREKMAASVAGANAPALASSSQAAAAPVGFKMPASFTKAIDSAVSKSTSATQDHSTKGSAALTPPGIAAMLQQQREREKMSNKTASAHAQSSMANTQSGDASVDSFAWEQMYAAQQMAQMKQMALMMQMGQLAQMSQASQPAPAPASGQEWEETGTSDNRQHKPPEEEKERSEQSSSEDDAQDRRKEAYDRYSRPHQTSTMAEREAGGDGLDEENRFIGEIREFSKSKGFGFIECPAAKAKFGGHDIWIHRSQMFSFRVGDEVSFLVNRNRSGQPQARSVILARDIPRIKARKEAEEMRTAMQLQAKKNLLNGAVAREPAAPRRVMSEAEARNFQASLKRKRD